MIKLVRCDDRLIHGQCVTRIIPIYGIKAIIAIDNATATNAMLKKIFVMAAPKGIKTVVVTEEDSISLIQEAIQNDVPTLIIMRVPVFWKNPPAIFTGARSCRRLSVRN